MKGLIDIGGHYAEEYFNEPNRDNMNWLFFEPISSTFHKMVERLPNTANIQSFNLALGDRTGDVMMYTETANQGQSSSILMPKLHLTQYPHIKFNGRENVKIDKLDNIPYDRSLYDVIHIDTQGTELQVLLGAIESLRYINEITIEVNKEELYEGCPMVEDITAFLVDRGFSLYSIDWMGKNWGDALYLKNAI